LIAKSIFVSKTFWFNAITMVIAMLEATDVINVLPPNTMKYVAAFIAAGNIVLRRITDTPVRVMAPNTVMTVPTPKV
jgi:hypothetical protein